jgi:hypothetical protein
MRISLHFGLADKLKINSKPFLRVTRRRYEMPNFLKIKNFLFHIKFVLQLK